MDTYISASLLAADLSKIDIELERITNAGVDMLHFDVMDGVFVDNISFGLPLLSCIQKCTDLILDIHLMIINPLKYIQRFAELGADIITFHLECDDDAYAVIESIRSTGKRVGISIRPETDLNEIWKYLDKVDMVLLMTVTPGFGGQSYIESSTEKIAKLKRYIDEKGLKVDIQVDGGINDKTAPLVRAAGANNLVAGSYIFKAASVREAVITLRQGDLADTLML